MCAVKNLIECVNKAIHSGEISKAAGEDIKEFYKREINEGKTPASEAALKALQEADYKKQRQKYLAGLSAKAKQETEAIMREHPDGLVQGLLSLITKDRMQAMGNSNVEYRASAIMDLSMTKFGEVLENLRTKWGGFRMADDVALGEDMVRELFKADSGNPKAKDFAKLWADIAEDLRQQFNAAGGDIRKLEDWGLPQSHNMFKIGKAGKEAWIAFTKEHVDLAKMEVGDNVDEFLGHVYETITTGGLNTLQAGKVPKGVSSARANAHREHRVLIFKDGDSWLDYQKKFGQDDVFNAMTDHIRGMSNDIALLEIFGPNPDHTFDYLKDVARAEGKLGSFDDGYLDAVYRVASGRVDSSASVTKGDLRRESIFGTMRSIIVASKLGSAVVSSVTDMGTLLATAKMNNVPLLKTLATGFKTMGSKDAQQLGIRLGLGADAFQGTVGSRFAEMGYGKAQQFADFTLRASGIGAWTEGFRKGFGIELMSHLGEQTKKTFNDLPDQLKEEFTKRGVSSDDWELIRSAGLDSHNGGEYISPEKIIAMSNDGKVDAGKARELAIKIMEYVKTETDYAIIQPDARVRALTTWGGQKGTTKGEAARTLMMFKSFPIAMLTTHMSRGLHQKTNAGKAVYLGSFLLTTTALGAIAVQLKQMAVGKDPKDMTEPKFWGAAIAQGGGVGILGDFFFQDQTRYGNSAWASLGGPAAAMVEDAVFKITIGNIQKAFDEKKESSFMSDAFNFIYTNTPGQNLWYTRLAAERLIKDQINGIIGGRDFERKQRRKIRKLKKEEHQEYWWTPSETMPSKAPDLAKIKGE